MLVESQNTQLNNNDIIANSSAIFNNNNSIDNINDNNIDNNNISVIGIEPIQSPRKAIQKLLHNNESIPNIAKPRLVIEKLVLTNFKSYAGKQEIGPFHQSFSAVVGPNGSGKSNVIDSMLFVFGFRASKMRQTKLKELIHNSENYPNLQFCKVDIHFKKIIDNYDNNGNNLNNPTIIENSNLIVSRKATINNNSIYYINNLQSNYTNVTNLLKSEGIDLDHKRFLILQGEVEMIAQMKPKAENDNDDGLLEYLEDIIGTSTYKEEIELINNQIDNLQDIFNEKEKRFNFAKDDFHNLEISKNKALDYLKLEKLLKDETFKYWNLTKIKNKISINKYTFKRDELNEKIKDDLLNIEKFKKNIDKFKDEKLKLNNNLSNLNIKINKFKDDLKFFEKEKVSINENLKINNKKLKNLIKTLDSNNKNFKSNENELLELNSNLLNYDNEINEFNENLKLENNELNKIKSELSTETKKFSIEIEKLQNKLEPWKNKIDQNQSNYNIKNSELILLENQLNSLINEKDKLKKLLIDKNEQLNLNNSKINSINEKKNTFNSNISRHKKDFQIAGNELKKLEIELKNLNNKIDDAKFKVSNVESQNKVLNALNKLKETGRINGFYGKLGDLGIIDDKYDIAISTGVGSLNDYVVDTVNDAQNCIQYLRSNNLGFGKFIVLEKLRKFNLNKINTPENVPRLFDLIKPIDEKFKPAFYSSMYDTLVTDNLEIANRVAFGSSKRWRVVTLDGKLVDVSGTMTGGGNRVNRGGMRLSSSNTNSNIFNDIISPNELQAMKDELFEREDHYKNLENSYRKMDQILRNSEEEIPRMTSEILRLTIDNKNLNIEINELNKILNENDEKNINEIQLLREKIKIYKNELIIISNEKSKLEENSNHLQMQIDELQNKILDIGGIRLKTQTAKVQSLKDSINLKIEMKENDELKVTKLQSQNNKILKIIENNKIQINELNEIINKLNENFNKINEEYEKIDNEYKKILIKHEEISNKIIEIDEKIDDENIKIEEKSKLTNDTLKKINRIDQMLKDFEIEVNHAINEINNIEIRDVEPYISWISKDDKIRNDLIQMEIKIDENIYMNEDGEEELSNMDLKTLGDSIDSLKIELSDSNVNLDLLLIYGDKEKKFKEQEEDVKITKQNLEEIKLKSKELNDKRHNEFKAGFDEISITLKGMYNLITAGGMAELEYYDSHDAFSEGIIFSVMPPKKSWRTISNLSGGEKTLASLALVFALHHYKPTPLYVMDEIDAALDFKNVSIVANYIKSRTKDAQFIVISLRNNMFELAESLVGIYKVNNMTKSATLVNKDLIK